MIKDKKGTSQIELIVEYFVANPNRDIPHAEVVKWLYSEYKERTGKTFADPDRGIRSLSQKGFLVKVKKGVYRYDPDFVVNRELEDFTEEQRKQIFERDGHKCVICGKGIKDGIELQADHIKPKDLGGTATIENGQTLCAKHNFRKRNLGQTETGKKMFIRLYELSRSNGDTDTMQFCHEILEVFEKNDVNGHVEWKK
ncbi:MAG: HNH endonuclease [Firmicutes bacterium]|nr:HNH endonuclease [Bacillota bacterium]